MNVITYCFPLLPVFGALTMIRDAEIDFMQWFLGINNLADKYSKRNNQVSNLLKNVITMGRLSDGYFAMDTRVSFAYKRPERN